MDGQDRGGMGRENREKMYKSSKIEFKMKNFISKGFCGDRVRGVWLTSWEYKYEDVVGDEVSVYYLIWNNINIKRDIQEISWM